MKKRSEMNALLPAGALTGALLRRAQGEFLADLDRALHKFDVTGSQYLLLSLLDGGCGSNPKCLADGVGIDRGAVTRLIDRLVRKEILERKPCTKDRRVCFTELTKKGRKLMPNLESVAQGVTQRSLKNFDDFEVKTLQSLLEKMIKNCEN